MTIKNLETRNKKNSFLSKQILSFYQEAKNQDEKKAKIAIKTMARKIFRTENGGKKYKIEIIKDKELLKTILDKIFQPDIAVGTFSSLIKNQKINANKLIDNLENTYNSKLVSATKYGS